MKYNRSNTIIGILIVISVMITSLLVYQSTYAQLQVSALNASNPQINDNSNITDQSSVQFLHEPILIISGDNNETHVVWEELVDGKSEIFYAKRTTDGFYYKTNLSLSRLVDSVKPSMMVDDQIIYFAWWEKYDNGTQIPMFRASSDSGNTFGAMTILSNIPY
jgi:hypothetical protein